MTGKISPKLDEVQINVFGPGYGECAVIHIGSGHWLVVDSCLDDVGVPVAISFLESIGVDLSKDVKLILATHWDDDHVRGLSDVFSVCLEAKFCLSQVMRVSEFQAYLSVFDKQPVINLDKGGTELLKCIDIANATRRRVKAAKVDTVLFDCEGETMAHGQQVVLRALSPSEAQYHRYINGVKNFENLDGRPKGRLIPGKRNEVSIASLLTIGDDSLLLGADLENRHRHDEGWAAVISEWKDRPVHSRVYKIAHHGSPGADNDEIWEHLLAEKPISIVTPWKKGAGRLPSAADVSRLSERPGQTFATSLHPITMKRKYSSQDRKLIKSMGVNFGSRRMRCGHVQITFKPGDDSANVGLFDGAEAIET